MCDEGAKESLTVLEGSAVAVGGRGKDLDLTSGKVGQRVHLQVRPGRLDRIELGWIGRQQPSSPVELLGQKVSHLDRAVHVEAVPYQHHRPVELAPQGAEEL